MGNYMLAKNRWEWGDGRRKLQHRGRNRIIHVEHGEEKGGEKEEQEAKFKWERVKQETSVWDE